MLAAPVSERFSVPGRAAAPRQPVRRPGLPRVLRALAWTVILGSVGVFAVGALTPLWFGLHDQRLLVVTSGSMAPFLEAGDAVVIQAITDPSQLRVGQVATFWPPGGDRLVTHRIVDLHTLPLLTPDPTTGELVPQTNPETGVAIERPFIVTKGDANQTIDPDATPLSRVRGVVLEVHPGWGRALGWAHSPLGRWTLLAPPLVLLAGMELAAVAAERRRRAPVREEIDALLLD